MKHSCRSAGSTPQFPGTPAPQHSSSFSGSPAQCVSSSVFDPDCRDGHLSHSMVPILRGITCRTRLRHDGKSRRTANGRSVIVPSILISDAVHTADISPHRVSRSLAIALDAETHWAGDPEKDEGVLRGGVPGNWGVRTGGTAACVSMNAARGRASTSK